MVGGDDVGGYTEGGPTSDLFRAGGATFVGRYGRTGGPRQQPWWELRSHRQIKAISIDGQVNYRPDMHDLDTRLLAGAPDIRTLFADRTSIGRYISTLVTSP